MEILNVVDIAQYMAVNEMVGIADALASIIGQTHTYKPIDQRCAVECIFVQLAIDKTIGADNLSTIVQMMLTKLLAQLSDVLGRLWLIESMAGDTAQLLIVGLQYSPDGIVVAEETRRHKYNLTEVQECFQKRELDVDARHAFHDECPDGQRNRLQKIDYGFECLLYLR